MNFMWATLTDLGAKTFQIPSSCTILVLSILHDIAKTIAGLILPALYNFLYGLEMSPVY